MPATERWREEEEEVSTPWHRPCPWPLRSAAVSALPGYGDEVHPTLKCRYPRGGWDGDNYVRQRLNRYGYAEGGNPEGGRVELQGPNATDT